MIERITVVVPAADEETTIGPCLAALTVAAAQVPWAVRVVVVLDACTDGTAQVVARAPGVESITCAARNVGRARRIGAEWALRGERAPEQVLLASTDADSTVPRHWLAHLLTHAEHAELVLGTVVPDGDLPPALARVWHERHVLGDGHGHVHAANLAVRADAYLAVGGWRALASGEDVDLSARVADAGLRVCRTGEAPVRTSTRAAGRAPQGFSSYLRALGHR